MKILQVTPVFYPAVAYGGIVGVVHEISKRLAERGHEVTIYTTDANKDSRIKDNFSNMDKVEIYYFKNISNSLAWTHRLFISLSMILSIKKEIRNFDIIHIHDFRTFQSIVASHYAKKYGVPYVLQPHGSITSDVSKQRLKKWFDIVFGCRILKGAEKILALNETEAKKCTEMGVEAENIEVVPNGIDLAGYKSLPRRGEFRRKYGVDGKIVLYLGRIDKSKGLDLLFRAFAGISRKLDDLKLVIVGPDDGYLSNLKELIDHLKINDKIIFTGFISGKDKLSAYVDADVFVTPSFYGFPLTFLEAMACGVPIITTDKGDFIEGIDNEVVFVVRYTEKELENALFRILTDDELRERFRRNCREKISEYDWEVIVNKIEGIYSSVVKRDGQIC